MMSSMLKGSVAAAAALALTLGAGCAGPESSRVADSETPSGAGVERVDYASSNVDFFRDVFAGRLDDDPVALHGRLWLPEGDGRFPVVIYQHGSGHPELKSYDAYRNQLREGLAARGIGFFIADSYTGRGIHETSRNQGQPSRSSRVIDAFRALEALSKHPRVDPARIGITGTSFGGIVSFLTSHEPWAEAVLPGGPRFAAHIPLYASCLTHPDPYLSTGAPLLFLLAGLDDTSPDHCLAHIEKMKAAGVDVEGVVYPDAHHGFISTKQVRWLKDAWNFGDCAPGRLESDGEFRSKDYTSEGITWVELVRLGAQTCGKRGSYMGRNNQAAKDALERSISFFGSHLKS